MNDKHRRPCWWAGNYSGFPLSHHVSPVIFEGSGFLPPLHAPWHWPFSGSRACTVTLSSNRHFCKRLNPDFNTDVKWTCILILFCTSVHEAARQMLQPVQKTVRRTGSLIDQEERHGCANANNNCFPLLHGKVGYGRWEVTQTASAQDRICTSICKNYFVLWSLTCNWQSCKVFPSNQNPVTQRAVLLSLDNA